MIRTRRTPGTTLFVAAALALAACGGDDSSLATTTTTAAAAETTQLPDTTAAPDTTDPDAVDTTEATEATAEFVAFTSDELVAALPTAEDLGEGWTESDGTPAINPEGAEGLGVGTCGGPNGAGRGLASGAIAIVLGSNQLGPTERRGSTSIYAFPDDVAAQAFVDLTAETINCSDGVTWERIQKANPVAPNEFNGFGAGFEDVTENQIWAFTETADSTYAEGGTDVLFVMLDRFRELTTAGITFSQVDTTLLRYDRYDNIVLVTTITGAWDLKGYIGAEDFVNFEPTADDLDEYTALVQPAVLARLGWE